MNKKGYLGDPRYAKVYEKMELLGIVDISTKRQSDNGTIVWRLPIKDQDSGILIEVASFASGYVRNQGKSCHSNYQLNKTKMKLEFTSWVNINEPGSKNVLHAHKNSSFAVVYYLQGIDTGNLIFRNPSNLLSDCSNTSPFVRGIAHTPKDGDLVLWPAWLPHEVEENKSDRQRINITTNINIG